MPRATATAAAEDARAAALAAFIKQTNAKSPGAVMTSSSVAQDIEAISTGALTVDYALGCGGLPRGRIVELYGPEMSGKTSLALSASGNAIADGGMAGFIDVENAINFDHVRDMGVDDRYFALSQPDSGEEALQMMEQMMRSRQFSIITLDSVAALVPKAELDGEIGDTHVGLTARLMSQALRKLAGVANETHTTLVFINQLREKVGQMYGNPETTPGGRALKYFASVRLEVRSPAGDRITIGSGKNAQPVGQTCNVTVKKNKVGVPFKKASYDLIYTKGIDTNSTILDVAVATGVWVQNPGGVYLDGATGEKLEARGKDNIKELLRQNPEWADQVRERVLAQMREPVSAAPVNDDPSTAEELEELGISA